MTNTTFTINTSSVFNNIPTLRQLGAVAVAWHAATPNNFAECYCGGDCNWTFGLPEATTFNIPGTHSRNSLRNLLGADAMVRGVRVSE